MSQRNNFKGVWMLLYIEFAISFLIGQKQTDSEFSKSAPMRSSGCRLYNNHVKDTQGQGHSRSWTLKVMANHVMYGHSSLFLRVIMSSWVSLTKPYLIIIVINCYLLSYTTQITQSVLKQCPILSQMHWPFDPAT